MDFIFLCCRVLIIPIVLNSSSKAPHLNLSAFFFLFAWFSHHHFYNVLFIVLLLMSFCKLLKPYFYYWCRVVFEEECESFSPLFTISKSLALKTSLRGENVAKVERNGLNKRNLANSILTELVANSRNLLILIPSLIIDWNSIEFKCVIPFLQPNLFSKPFY